MLKLILVRHGETQGNKLKRYIGKRTDEPLCPEAGNMLAQLAYPEVQAVYASPMIRCTQTAGILFPGKKLNIIDELAECDFGEFENKKFQIMVIHDTPERLPFVSLGQSEKIEKDVIYVRRGTKSEKATSEEINRIIERKIATIYSENTDMSLDQHLEQLKKLYSELPQKIRVLVRKGSQPNFAAALKVFGERIGALYGTPDEYEEKDNPNYPDEGYEAFILRMIDAKKLKIEKVLDLK